ncbi:Sec1 domain-containing protein 2 [Rhizophlyctis rosea]|nr:Sec1 domain-containing protein 2 [Rhizophlyctis rosea]
MPPTRKRLVDLIAKESLDFKVPRQLEKFLAPFRGDERVLRRRAPVLQCLAAAVQTLEESNKSHWEELASVEKIMLLSLSETSDPGIVVQQIKDVLSRASRAANVSDDSAHFSFHDVVLLLAYSFAVIGTTLRLTTADENALKDALYQALLRSLKEEGEEQKLDDPFYRSKLQSWLNDTFTTLFAIGRARSGLHHLRNVLHPTSTTPYQSVIKQVMLDALKTDRVPAVGDVDDLVHVSHGGTLGGVLSGFSRFLGGGRPHPSQFQSLIVLVVGGVTFAEVREIRECAREKGVKVLVGSTDIAGGATVFKHLFTEPPI